MFQSGHLSQVFSLGFDPEMAKKALENCGSIQKAIDQLIRNGGIISTSYESSSGGTTESSSGK
jgi:hypothetical protein